MGREITIEAKYVLAAYEVPKSMARELSGKRMLQGVRVNVDKAGKWRVESCDSYKVALIDNGYVPGKNADYSFTVPPEALGEFKQTDKFLTFKPDLEKMTCKVEQIGRNGVREWEFALLEGNWPDVDRLRPSGMPSACYRYAMAVNADYLACLMGVVRKALGKGAAVEMGTQEDAECKPVFGYASDGDVRVTLLLMPLKPGGKDSALEPPRPREAGADELAKARKELEDARSNAELWKAKALDGGRVAELEAEVAEWKEKAAEMGRKFREEKAKRVESKAEPGTPESDGVEALREWAAARGLKVEQKREGTPVWVCGNSTEYKEELKAMGLKWGKHREFGKGWYLRVA